MTISEAVDRMLSRRGDKPLPDCRPGPLAKSAQSVTQDALRRRRVQEMKRRADAVRRIAPGVVTTNPDGSTTVRHRAYVPPAAANQTNPGMDLKRIEKEMYQAASEAKLDKSMDPSYRSQVAKQWRSFLNDARSGRIAPQQTASRWQGMRNAMKAGRNGSANPPAANLPKPQYGDFTPQQAKPASPPRSTPSFYGQRGAMATRRVTPQPSYGRNGSGTSGSKPRSFGFSVPETPYNTYTWDSSGTRFKNGKVNYDPNAATRQEKGMGKVVQTDWQKRVNDFKRDKARKDAYGMMGWS